MKFGIGRYLYSLAPQWRDWNPQTKTFGKAPPRRLRLHRSKRTWTATAIRPGGELSARGSRLARAFPRKDERKATLSPSDEEIAQRAPKVPAKRGEPGANGTGGIWGR